MKALGPYQKGRFFIQVKCIAGFLQARNDDSSWFFPLFFSFLLLFFCQTGFSTSSAELCLDREIALHIQIFSYISGYGYFSAGSKSWECMLMSLVKRIFLHFVWIILIHAKEKWGVGLFGEQGRLLTEAPPRRNVCVRHGRLYAEFACSGLGLENLLPTKVTDWNNE